MDGYQKIKKIVDEKKWKISLTSEMYKDARTTRFDIECKNNHTWETCLRNLIKMQDCKMCLEERDNDEIKNRINHNINNDSKSTIEKGDNHEIFIANILTKNNINASRPVIGNNTFDIVINIDGINRGVQIKELRKCTRHKMGFATCFPTKYPDDTLIVLVNQKYNVYCLFHAQDVKTTSMTFTINGDIGKYNKFLYIDYNKFEKDLLEKCKQSYIIDDISNHFTDNSKKEYMMLKRLKENCHKLNIKFEYRGCLI